jgi:hypothetical protein
MRDLLEETMRDYPHGAECSTKSSPVAFNFCQYGLVVWGSGGQVSVYEKILYILHNPFHAFIFSFLQGYTYPKEAGLPVPTKKDGPVYYKLEIHYNNQGLEAGVVDSSGVRKFYTSKLRPNDIGLMMVGMPASYTQVNEIVMNDKIS